MNRPVFRRTSLPVALLASLALTTSAVAQQPGWSAPPIDRQVAICDGRTGESLAMSELLDQLAKADVVFLGETHLDESTHRFELAVYEGLLARRGQKVVLSLEMFERDVQKALDGYTSSTIDEAEFLTRSRPWGNYRTAYRRLVERARKGSLPVVAANFPRMLRRALGSADDPFSRLDERLRPLAPDQLLPNGKGYWRRVDNAVRGHLGMMGGPADPDDPRLLDMQSLWDNSMGEACAKALDSHANSMVLHVNGGFHTAYWDGTARQFALRKPDAKLLTVDIVPVANPKAGMPDGLPRADYVAYVEARANDVNEGFHTVVTSRELRYQLHVPDGVAADARLPMLLWLGQDGLTPQDGMDLWIEQVGRDAVVAVIEAPYRERGPDLGESGRWFWADTFRQDVGFLTQAIERTWGYACRNLPVDPDRVVLAGEGSGATVAAAATMLSGRLGIDCIAIDPRRYSKIKDFPLPLPELWGDDTQPKKRIVVLGSESDRVWWQDELEAWQGVGIETAFTVRGEDRWGWENQTSNAIRRALDLPAAKVSADAARAHVVVPGSTPRARHWARLFAMRRAGEQQMVALLDRQPADDLSQPLNADIDPVSYGEQGPLQLPRCPGPFGGSTVVVLPIGLPDERIQAWLQLEANDPLNKRSRFHRLRVARIDDKDDRGLAQTLEQLRTRNRTNVLIIPAAFCADAETMRDLAQQAAAAEDTMTLHWLPGLGGQQR
jgi:uncharacterized iron-regulated protein